MSNKEYFITHRYIRPIDFDNVGDDIKENMNGITISAFVDYETRVVSVGFSICRNENFDKKTGMLLSTISEKEFIFNYSDIVKYKGITNATIALLNDLFPKYAVGENPTYRDVERLFMRAMRSGERSRNVPKLEMSFKDNLGSTRKFELSSFLFDSEASGLSLKKSCILNVSDYVCRSLSDIGFIVEEK